PPPANTLFRKLPSTDDVLHTRELEPLISRDGQPAVTAAIRTVLDCLREQIAASAITEKQVDLAIQGLTAAIDRELRSGLGFSLRQVINATGVILHTNLGRALLSESALDHIRETAATYSNLEFNLATGDRGNRDIHVDRLFQRLFAGIHTDAPAQSACRWRRGHRLSRRVGRNWRFLPHPRRHVEVERISPRSWYNQSHARRRLRTRYSCSHPPPAARA